MITAKDVVEYAKKQGYESAYLTLRWNGYEVYQPIYSGEMSYIGLPLFILVKQDKIRMSNPSETFEIFDLINEVDEK